MSQKILLESGTNELEVVEFYVDQDDYRGHYGINVAKVVEISRRQTITAMPEMRHPAVRGAFAHRTGRIVPLVDIAVYLGYPPIEDPDAKVIVTEFNTVLTSFLVSGVNRIYRLSWTDVEAPGSMLQGMSRNSITGVVRLDGRVVFLLDLESIVAMLHPNMALRMNPPAPENSTPQQPLRILHVDDSGSIRKMVLSLLARDGRFDVIQSVDGQAAWDQLVSWRDESAASGRPLTDFVQGIISDIEMPRMDGLALCRRIKEDAVLRALPVAMFSSLINESLARKCEAVGSDAQYAKPDLTSLSDKLCELIAR